MIEPIWDEAPRPARDLNLRAIHQHSRNMDTSPLTPRISSEAAPKPKIRANRREVSIQDFSERGCVQNIGNF
ncbi:MAG: hypothetical protein HN736_08550 [Anaerolineae bacterium]|jgi:hypothetical protein|nr:hypothetical protein [Anaerolineae bacterium]MBT3712972.1 hypothetical protein [Anaerolineae bacterium]MBT4309740.1 hypothetical protein [Anaerolineae bacterium]MBT4457961.1 hypothetical protein [Anaerolineae bacterium]MBT4841363.1 hypothetical protein [Anaerolineae bacterium]